LAFLTKLKRRFSINYNSHNILLVEDNLIDAQLFSEMLCVKNKSYLEDKYFVTHIQTAEEALDIDLNDSYDVIFLDINLPGMSGIDAINSINTKCNNTPIVMMTSEDRGDLASKAMMNGCQDYLIKGEHTPSMIKRSIRYALERKRIQNQLLKMAHYDSLTDLLNREAFYIQLNMAVSLAKRKELAIAIFFIDLDNFKSINDSFGHDAGDKILSKVAERLKESTRLHDSVSRFGGDEFVILLNGLGAPISDCENIAKRIIRSVNKPINYEGNMISVGCSIGISNFSNLTDESHTLVRKNMLYVVVRLKD